MELHDFARSGDLASVKKQFSWFKKPDVDVRDPKGYTPFMLAVLNGHRDVAEFLVSKGANINAVDNEGVAVYHRAAAGGVIHALTILKELGSNSTIADRDGDTPLYYAASNGKIDAVKVLLKSNANPNAANKDGVTPIFVAVDPSKSLELVASLVEAGAKVNIKNNAGRYLLHFAASSGNVEIVKYLLAKGADPKVAKPTGWTPLHDAVAFGFQDIIQVLIEAGSDVNAANQEGITPLISAERHGFYDIMKTLILHGAKREPNQNDYSARKVPLKTWKTFFFDAELSNVKLNPGTIETAKAVALELIPEMRGFTDDFSLRLMLQMGSKALTESHVGSPRHGTLYNWELRRKFEALVDTEMRNALSHFFIVWMTARDESGKLKEAAPDYTLFEEIESQFGIETCGKLIGFATLLAYQDFCYLNNLCHIAGFNLWLDSATEYVIKAFQAIVPDDTLKILDATQWEAVVLNAGLHLYTRLFKELKYSEWELDQSDIMELQDLIYAYTDWIKEPEILAFICAKMETNYRFKNKGKGFLRMIIEVLHNQIVKPVEKK